MPSRLVTLLIVGLWLGMVGWFLTRDFFPRWTSDASPNYLVKVVDEARPLQERWSVIRQVGKKRAQYRMLTTLNYAEADDSFALLCELRPVVRRLHTPGITLIKMESQYCWNREGRLIEATALFRYDMQMAGVDIGEAETKVTLNINDTTVTPRWYRTWENPIRGTWPTFQVSSFHRRILLPLHPLHQMSGLKVGQTWTAQLLDLEPFGLDSDLPKKSALRTATATVTAPPLEDCVKLRGKPEPCFLIHYDAGDNITIDIQVQQSAPHQVLYYQFKRDGKSWTFFRGANHSEWQL